MRASRAPALLPERPAGLWPGDGQQRRSALRGVGSSRGPGQPADATSCAVFQDFFFYSLVYDPQQKTLLADKGEIRVGNRYQADITDLLKEGGRGRGQRLSSALSPKNLV